MRAAFSYWCWLVGKNPKLSGMPFSYCCRLVKARHLLERGQLFAMQRMLAWKLSTKTEQLLTLRLLKRERKLQDSYEVSGGPVCKSVNSYEGEPKD